MGRNRFVALYASACKFVSLTWITWRINWHGTLPRAVQQWFIVNMWWTSIVRQYILSPRLDDHHRLSRFSFYWKCLTLFMRMFDSECGFNVMDRHLIAQKAWVTSRIFEDKWTGRSGAIAFPQRSTDLIFSIGFHEVHCIRSASKF